MTIIQNKKTKNKLGLWNGILLLTILIFSFFNIYFYNQSVNLRHEIDQQKGSLQNIQVANADFKNRLYAMSNTQKLEDLAANGFVLDKNPEYVQKQNLVLNN